MKSLWNDTEAGRYTTEVDLRRYTSRLLGRDPALVPHGGGNTSVKVRERSSIGEEEDILYVKGSGWDLEIIYAPSYAAPGGRASRATRTGPRNSSGGL